MKGGYRFGSGRRGRLTLVEDCDAIDVRHLSRCGVLTPGEWIMTWRNPLDGTAVRRLAVRAGADTLLLSHLACGKSISARLRLSHTSCGFGGQRSWFHCPVCDGRAAMLYVHGNRLACRLCHELTYRSRRGSEFARAWNRFYRLGRHLTVDFQRPKGMHYAKCIRIMQAMLDVGTLASSLVDRRLAMLNEELRQCGISLE
jgi:hypothetical protein